MDCIAPVDTKRAQVLTVCGSNQAFSRPGKRPAPDRRRLGVGAQMPCSIKLARNDRNPLGESIESVRRTIMKLVAHPYQPRTGSALAIAVFLAIAAFPNLASAASPTQSQAPTRVMTVAAHNHVETRIDNLHVRLQITAAQEELWQKVAQVMRDNAGAMDSLRQARTSNANNMSAVDDLKSYGQIADAHADGIRKLTPAFLALYDSMSDVQKKNADLIFRTGHHHSAKKG